VFAGFGWTFPDWRGFPPAAFSLPMPFVFTDMNVGNAPLLVLHAL
jgi:hypothetical protein